MEENSIDGTVELIAEEFVLANEHEIYETIVNEDDSLINIVYPNILGSIDDENVRPLIQVLLNVPKNDNNEFQNVTDFIDLIRTEDDKDISMQNGETVDSNVCTDKERSFEDITEKSTECLTQEADDNQIVILKNDSNPNDVHFEAEPDLDQSDILKNFMDKVIVTQYKCKFCALQFDSLPDAQTHFISQHVKSQKFLANDSFEKPSIMNDLSTTGDCGSENSACSNTIESLYIPKLRTKRLTKRGRSMLKNKYRKYPCEWPNCNYVARIAVHLKDHMRVHTGEKPFRCNWNDCAQGFSQASALKTHMRTHTGEKPFRCKWPGCSLYFSQKSNLSGHMRTHTGEKPFKCDWPGCESRFAIKGNLEDHKKIHVNDKEFACDHPGCTRRFTQNSYLRKHKQIHQNEKPFACDWPGCSYRSIRQGDVTIHKKTHTGEKRYLCDICQKSFTRQNHLKKHISQIHSNGHIESNAQANSYLLLAPNNNAEHQSI